MADSRKGKKVDREDSGGRQQRSQSVSQVDRLARARHQEKEPLDTPRRDRMGLALTASHRGSFPTTDSSPDSGSSQPSPISTSSTSSIASTESAPPNIEIRSSSPSRARPERSGRSPRFAALFSTSNKEKSPGKKDKESPRPLKVSGSPRTPTSQPQAGHLASPIDFLRQGDIDEIIRIGRKRMEKASPQVRRNGQTFRHTISRDVSRSFEIVVTGDESGSYSDESEIGCYVLDRTSKLGEGARADAYVAYSLPKRQIVTAKVFHDRQQVVDMQVLLTEKKNWEDTKEYLGGMNVADILSEGEKIIILPFVLGQTYLHTLYRTDGALKQQWKEMASQAGMSAEEKEKITKAFYRANPDYYAEKNKLSHAAQFRMLIQSVRSVGSLHKHKKIHRDVSLDNLLIYKPESSEEFTGGLVDRENAINVDGAPSYKIRAAYAYAAPELFRLDANGESNPLPATPAVDFYALGVVWLDVLLPDVNLQRLFKLKAAANKALIKPGRPAGACDELTLPELKKLAGKMFTESPAEMQLFCFNKQDTIEHFVYQHFSFPTLRKLNVSLLQEDPALRLAEFSGEKLEKLEEQLVQLLKDYEILSYALETIIESLVQMQKDGVNLQMLSDLLEDPEQTDPVVLLGHQKKLALCIQKEGLIRGDSQADGLEVTIKNIANLCMNLSQLIKGLKLIKPFGLTLGAITPAMALCSNPQEVIDFLTRLSEKNFAYFKPLQSAPTGGPPKPH